MQLLGNKFYDIDGEKVESLYDLLVIEPEDRGMNSDQHLLKALNIHNLEKKLRERDVVNENVNKSKRKRRATISAQAHANELMGIQQVKKSNTTKAGRVTQRRSTCATTKAPPNCKISPLLQNPKKHMPTFLQRKAIQLKTDVANGMSCE